MSKVVLSYLIIFCFIHTKAQTFYVVSGVPSNLNVDSAVFMNSNKTYQLHLGKCDSIKIYTCLPINANSANQDYFYLDMAIDTSQNIYWLSSEGGLYRRKFNDSTSCEFLGVFDNDYPHTQVNALTTDVSGNVFAIGYNDSANSSRLYSYNPLSKIFTNLGDLPKNYSSSGDLFFYEGKLFLTARTSDSTFLLQIPINNPSQSCYYMKLGKLYPYGAFAVQNGKCSDAYIISSTDSTSTLYKLDLYSKTISRPICTYPFAIFGAASVYKFSPSIIDSNTCAPVDSCNSLPIYLLNFTSTFVNNSVKLQWETAIEINSSYFSVERSNDGINFASIGRVNAAGPSNGLRSYSYIDIKPQTVNYYKLKEVDKDGKFTYSNILLVKDANLNSFTILQNPVQNILQLHSNQSGTYFIYDFSGMRIQTGTAQTGSQSISISSLSSGRYVVQMITINGNVGSKIFEKK